MELEELRKFQQL